MKKYCLSVLSLSIVAFASCNPRTQNRQVTIERDCTGVYLRYEGKDYQVCNRETISNYPDGATVMVQYVRLPGCQNPINYPVCEMLHPSEGWVKVRSVE